MEKINLVHLQLVQMWKCKRQVTASKTFHRNCSLKRGRFVSIILGAPDSYLVEGWVRPIPSCTR
jgi:hypothetical protein